MIKPYLISIEFDKRLQRVDDSRWVISADVNIGDRLKVATAKSFRNKLFRRVAPHASLGGEFLYVVCSPVFKQNPTKEYSQHINRAYVQQEFDEVDAVNHLTKLVEGMGEVTLEEFTNKIHDFLETEEWDYLMEANSSQNSEIA